MTEVILRKPRGIFHPRTDSLWVNGLVEYVVARATSILFQNLAPIIIYVCHFHLNLTTLIRLLSQGRQVDQ